MSDNGGNEEVHKFLRSAGFSEFQTKQEIQELLNRLIKESGETLQFQINSEKLCQVKIEAAPELGICIVGEKKENEELDVEYYFPYLTGEEITSTAECSIQRHTERETYAGLLDEYRVGISLIFYICNSIEYRIRRQKRESYQVKAAHLSGFSVKGKILLPIQKTAVQIEQSKIASRTRSSLLEAAKNGDADAIDTLTIEDIDLYSQVTRRAQKEDLYSIIDSCFMPCGIECDQYSVIGEIKHIEYKENRFTGEKVYDLTLESCDLIFHVGINEKDLTGEPKIGRRFKGQIWMQGIVDFKE